VNKAEFNQVFALADSDTDLSNIDDTILDGCALRDFQPVTTTVEVCAKAMRHHALCIYRKADQSKWVDTALTELREYWRRKVTLVSSVEDR
jgi:hypothetical protein